METGKGEASVRENVIKNLLQMVDTVRNSKTPIHECEFSAERVNAPAELSKTVFHLRMVVYDD